MNTLIWPAAILFLSVTLLVLEMFIPSGGILGFLSVVAMIASIADQIVEVIEVSGNRIVVAPSAGPLQKSRTPQKTERDLLSQPLDSLGLDDLGNPLS